MKTQNNHEIIITCGVISLPFPFKYMAEQTWFEEMLVKLFEETQSLYTGSAECQKLSLGHNGKGLEEKESFFKKWGSDFIQTPENPKPAIFDEARFKSLWPSEIKKEDMSVTAIFIRHEKGSDIVLDSWVYEGIYPLDLERYGTGVTTEITFQVEAIKSQTQATAKLAENFLKDKNAKATVKEMKAQAIAYYDMKVKSNLFQNIECTIPITAVGQEVLGVKDLSGNGHDLMARDIHHAPTYQVDAKGAGYLKFLFFDTLETFHPTTLSTVVEAVAGIGSVKWGSRITNGVTIGGTFGLRSISELAIVPGAIADKASALMSKQARLIEPGTVTNVHGYFYKESGFRIVDWDVSRVTDMTSLFEEAETFNQDITSWDTSGLVRAVSMFEGAEWFNQPIGNWNVANVEDFCDMFKQAYTFNQDISDWDTSNAIRLTGMFHGAKSFNQPIGKWNVSKVIDARFMFVNATFFNQSLDNWDVSGFKYLTKMFYDAWAFNGSLDYWKINPEANVSNMFNEDMAREKYSVGTHYGVNAELLNYTVLKFG